MSIRKATEKPHIVCQTIFTTVKLLAAVNETPNTALSSVYTSIERRRSFYFTLQDSVFSFLRDEKGRTLRQRQSEYARSEITRQAVANSRRKRATKWRREDIWNELGEMPQNRCAKIYFETRKKWVTKTRGLPIVNRLSVRARARACEVAIYAGV